MKNIRLITIALCSAFALFAAGCSTVSSMNPIGDNAGSKSGQATAKVLDKLTDLVSETESNLNATTSSLDSLVNKPEPDLRKQYKTFDKALKSLNNSIDKMEKAAVTLREKSNEYFPKWNEEIAAIQDSRLRRNIERRREGLMKSFDDVMAHYAKAKDETLPLISRLNDINVALSNDLTPTGLKNVSSSLKRALSDMDDVNEALDDLKDDFVKLSAEFSPTLSQS